MVVGGNSSDNALGGPGNDLVNGLRGSDNIVGGDGSDLLSVGPLRDAAVDTIYGAGGNDWVIAKNEPASKDIVTCGSGFDRVSADRKDVVAGDCERGYFGLTADEFIQRFIPQSFFEGLPPPPEG